MRGDLPQFGKRSGAKHMAIDLVNIAAGAGGFVIHGQDAGDRSGWSVSSAGDVNGDGFDDLIVGAPCGDGPANGDYAGDSYVVFGKAAGFARRASTWPPSTAARRLPASTARRADDSVGLLGRLGRRRQRRRLRRPDHRGASWRRPGTASVDAGESYVVFGKAGGFAARDRPRRRRRPATAASCIQRRGRGRLLAATRSPRRATSMATASTT